MRLKNVKGAKEKNESSKLIERVEDVDFGALVYESNKYGYYAELLYYFVEGKIYCSECVSEAIEDFLFEHRKVVY